MKRIIILCLAFFTLASCGNPNHDESDADSKQTAEAQNNESEFITESENEAEPAEHSPDAGWYLSITGSYNDENKVLSEVYSVFDFEKGELDRKYSIAATSSYPCSFSDYESGIVYYTEAEKTILNGREVMLDNIYSYDTATGEKKQLTTDGFFSNKLIKIEDRLFFAGAPRSTAGVYLGYVDLKTGELIVEKNIYNGLGRPSVRDIDYSYKDGLMYFTWYSGAEQAKLDQEFYKRQDEKVKDNVRELTSYYIERIDLDTMQKETVVEFTDFTLELFSASEDGEEILMYGIYDDDCPIRLYENGESRDYRYPGTALFALSEDGERIYFIKETGTKTNEVPNTALYVYDMATDKTEELAVFDFYVNNMVMAKK